MRIFHVQYTAPGMAEDLAAWRSKHGINSNSYRLDYEKGRYIFTFVDDTHAKKFAAAYKNEIMEEGLLGQ